MISIRALTLAVSISKINIPICIWGLHRNYSASLLVRVGVSGNQGKEMMWMRVAAEDLTNTLPTHSYWCPCAYMYAAIGP